MKAKHLFITIVYMFVFVYGTIAGPKANTKKTVTFQVSMHCQSCATRIEKEVTFEKGVKNLEINLEDKTVKVTFDSIKTNVNTLKKGIEKLGYEVKEK